MQSDLMNPNAVTPKKGLIDALMGGGIAGPASAPSSYDILRQKFQGQMGGGIAPGEGAPNAGPPPAVDAPMPPPIMADAPGGGAPPVATPGAAPDYTTLGQYSNALAGYNMDKFSRPYDQQSEKYKVGLVNSHFDPNQGITPAYLDALKSLDLADYSGSGDQLTVKNGRNGARYGTGGTADTVLGLHSGGNAKWGAWHIDDPQAPGGPRMAGGGVNPLLQGDPQAGIQQALGGYSQQSDFLQQLLAKLQGGQ